MLFRSRNSGKWFPKKPDCASEDVWYIGGGTLIYFTDHQDWCEITITTPEMKEKTDDDVKRVTMLMLGDMAVGKTCLASQFMRNEFTDTHNSTISDVMSKTAIIGDQQIVYQVWDTAGQERFRSLLPLYPRNINGAVLVYDVTNATSFNNLDVWLRDLHMFLPHCSNIALVGNKADMEANKTITTQEAEKYATEHGLIHLETSAKTGHNVENLFQKLALDIVKDEYEAKMTKQRIITSGDILNDTLKSRRRTCCS